MRIRLIWMVAALASCYMLMMILFNIFYILCGSKSAISFTAAFVQNVQSFVFEQKQRVYNLLFDADGGAPPAIKAIVQIDNDDELLIDWYLRDINNNEEYTAGKQPTLAEWYLLRNQALQYYFKAKLNLSDRKALLQTMKFCLQAVEAVGIRYFIYSGTLIGYFRHNSSLIPWDDDVDIALLSDSDVQLQDMILKLKAAIQPYDNTIALHYVEEQKRFKCFSRLANESHAISGYAWRWPFIDMQWMSLRKSFGLRDKQPVIVDWSYYNFRFAYNHVYPLRRVYFSEQKIPVYVPNDVLTVLQTNYDVNQCVSSSMYDHRKEIRSKRIISVDCSELTAFYNFTNLMFSGESKLIFQ